MKEIKQINTHKDTEWVSKCFLWYWVPWVVRDKGLLKEVVVI